MDVRPQGHGGRWRRRRHDHEDGRQGAGGGGGDLEAIYGRELLDHVAALTAELQERTDSLVAFNDRAIVAVAACLGAECRIAMPVGDDVPFGLLSVLSGIAELEKLAREIGLHGAIFDMADEVLAARARKMRGES